MPIINMQQLLAAAAREGYAVPAFNVSNLELARAVIETAADNFSPVIVQVHPVELEYAGTEALTAMLRAMGESVDIPMVLHLDHGDSYQTAVLAVTHGFTSIMYDGSGLPFADNVRETRRVVELCHAIGVSVEGELGVLGGTGAEVTEGQLSQLTDPASAGDFVRQTGVDTLAVAIGNEHGLYHGEGKRRIDLERLRLIAAQVDIPLVLHGGSDTPDETVQQAIGYGIRKVNISTDMKNAYRKAVHRYLSETDEYETHVINQNGIDAAKSVIRQKMEAFGCLGKAQTVLPVSHR